jgi:hypothetical protein
LAGFDWNNVCAEFALALQVEMQGIYRHTLPIHRYILTKVSQHFKEQKQANNMHRNILILTNIKS